MRLLILGSDARSHCLAWKLYQSECVRKIYAYPGNAGIFQFSHNTSIKDDSFDSIYKFCRKKGIELIIVGPEAYLCDGIYDYMKKRGISVFGPSYEGSKLEGSKGYAKRFMNKYNIPTAQYNEFKDIEKLKKHIKEANYPLVIKADGLAGGKGVKVCYSEAEAVEHIEKMKNIKNCSGEKEVFICEEFLQGKEASLLCFVDGKTIIPMIYSRDHKKALDGDKGENTGGMGTFSNPDISEEVKEYINKNIVQNTIKGIREENLEYKGVIFIGLMINNKKAWVIEYNVRFGDPETQVVLPLLKTDLGFVVKNVISQKLSGLKLEWEDKEAVCVVMVSQGYPEKYQKGKKISINKNINSLLFYAGVRGEHRNLYTDGGRVISVVARAKDLKEARRIAYKEIQKVSFENSYYRTDIALKN